MTRRLLDPFSLIAAAVMLSGCTTEPTSAPRPRAVLPERPSAEMFDQIITLQDWGSPSEIGEVKPLAASTTSGLGLGLESLTPDVCLAVKGDAVPEVVFIAVGDCTIKASQDGNDVYRPAEVQRTGRVFEHLQVITFTSTQPNPAIVNATYNVTAIGGGSGNPVTFSSNTPTTCTVAGNVVTFKAADICFVAADQAGSGDAYAPARQVTQKIAVVSPTYVFVGFSSPITNDGMNVAKAGQTIALKWRLVDAAGSAIANLTSATVTAKELACALGTSADQIAESAAGGSGLQNLGDGYYQFNWKTPSSYKGSCKTVTLTLGSGGTYSADFKFTK